jgi:putative transposase
MSTYTYLAYHIVFGTRQREGSLAADRREELYRYIWSIIKNKGGHLYRTGGTEDHIHILVGMPPMLCISDMVKEIKVGSSMWIKDKGIFSGWNGWQDGYAAFTCSAESVPHVVEYIKGQAQHHRQITFGEEFRDFLLKHRIEFDERYLM